jgi:hypothetical protein
MWFMLLLACFTPSDGEDWSDAGGWARVRSPPGHETAECWVWTDRGNPWVDALGGPVCFEAAK